MLSSASRLGRFLRAPSLHFLLLGTALLGVDRWARVGPAVAPDMADRRIVVTRAERARLRTDWAQQWGRPPGPAEEQALIAQTIEEEVLLREALARGLDRDDRVVRTRLAQLASFVGMEGEDADLEREARRLGLDRSDLVVRRYLIQTMRLLASRPTPEDMPDETAIEAWFAAHGDRFQRPERVDLVHVYLGRDRRGAALASDAAALLERLRREGTTPAEAVRLADPFIRGNTLTASSADDLTRVFGPGFADALAGLPLATWSGPVASAYGLHLVWIEARRPAEMPPLAAVRNQVVHGLLKERQDARLRARLAAWRQGYVVVVEGGDA